MNQIHQLKDTYTHHNTTQTYRLIWICLVVQMMVYLGECFIRHLNIYSSFVRCSVNLIKLVDSDIQYYFIFCIFILSVIRGILKVCITPTCFLYDESKSHNEIKRNKYENMPGKLTLQDIEYKINIRENTDVISQGGKKAKKL